MSKAVQMASYDVSHGCLRALKLTSRKTCSEVIGRGSGLPALCCMHARGLHFQSFA